MAIFLAGPLAAKQVLQALDARVLRAARLDGYALCAGDTAGLPLWTRGVGVDGVAVEVRHEAVRALAAALGAGISDVVLQDGTPADAVIGPAGEGPPWDAAGWSQRHAAGFAAAIPQLVAAGGTAASRLAMILSQSDAQLRAEKCAPAEFAAGLPATSISLKDRATAYRGFFSAEILQLDVPRFDGGTPLSLRREVFRGTDATLVLPYDPRRDEVLLVEQFRAGPYARGDARPWTLEPVAGLVDAGETPAEAAVRETVEEAGIHLDRVLPVAGAYPSPGITSEFYHLFIGLADLSAPAGGGLDHEGEDIRTHVLPYASFDAFLDTPAAAILPLLTLGLWLRAARPSLRQGG